MNIKLKRGYFHTHRKMFISQYDQAQYLSETGLDSADIDAGVDCIYAEGVLRKGNYSTIRAKMFAFALGNCRLGVNNFDCFAGIIKLPESLRRIENIRRKSIANEMLSDILPKLAALEKTCLSSSRLDLSHTTPDWDNILKLGVSGLLSRARQVHMVKPNPFTESVCIAYEAMRKFVLRFSDVCATNGREDLAVELRFLADNPPVTLTQALQLGLLYRDFQEIEGEWVRSLGIFDRLYFPFLKHDLEKGILDDEMAQELVTIYFSRFYARSHGRDSGTPFCFGGLLQDGVTDGCNQLTFMAFKSYRELGLVDPKFSLRINENTPGNLLLEIIECLKEGKTSTIFANEAILRKMFIKRGKKAEDLVNLLPIGCYEPAIMGKELSCTMSTLYNFAEVFEIALDKAPDDATFEDIEKLYLGIQTDTLEEALLYTARWEALWPEINPSPVLSGTMNSCMEKGLDVSQAGTDYSTSGVMCAGIGTAVDSLAAVQYLVYEKKLVSLAKLKTILHNNWEGEERLRLMAVKRAPKWGCDDEKADSLARKIVSAAALKINSTANAKGGFYQMGLWSIDLCMPFGRAMGATPDGRLKGDPISKNAGCTIGCDREGVSALMRSVQKLDHTNFPNGSVLDVMLLSRTVHGLEGTVFIRDLISSFFAGGGMFIHFNLLSPETLKAAQNEPDKYDNLQIRLCGWNVRFIDLDRLSQDCLIKEAASKEN